MSGKLYHFTTIDVLQKIIENAHFYAFNIKYSNDHQEFDDGYARIYKELKTQLDRLYKTHESNPEFVEGIKKMVSGIPDSPDTTDSGRYSYYGSELKRSSPEVYFVCFSTKGESLAQWIMYAKESGVSIEFNFDGYEFVDAGLPEKLSKYIEEKESRKVIINGNNDDGSKANDKAYASIRSFGSVIHDVKYDEDAIKDSIKRAVARVRKELKLAQQKSGGEICRIINSCFEEAPLIKGKEHEGEAESRIIIRPAMDVLLGDNNRNIPCHNVVNHLNIAGALTPYIKVAWEPKDKSKSPLHPIKSVIIGPGWNQDAVYKSVIHYLSSNKERIVSNQNQCKVAINVRQWFEENNKPENEFMTSAGILVKKSKSSHIFK